MSKRIFAITILLVLSSLVFCSINSLAQHPGGTPGGGGEQTGTETFNGNTDVGATWENTISDKFANYTIISIVFELTWTDEANSEPDTFDLITDDDMNDPKSDSSSSGTVTIAWDEERLNNVWNMAVTCDSAGPTTVPVGPLGFLTQEEPDPGNSWTLVVTYTYTEGGGGPGGPPAYVTAVLNSPIFKVHIALMIASTFLFLGSGLVAGVHIFSYTNKGKSILIMKKVFATPALLYFLVILAFILFFLASVPIGMWVAGMFYGWHKAWTGFPTFWNPEMYSFTNADNVSFIVLLLWAIPIWLNRRQIMQSKWYKKLFGWSNFLMARADKAPNPRLSNLNILLCYFFMGILIYVVFMVQPHGSGS